MVALPPVDSPPHGGLVLATACDRNYAWAALNLIGSVQCNSPDTFTHIHVWDIGLTARQRLQFRGIRGATVQAVPPFCPHWRQCWSWKPWLWVNTDADYLMYLDAGTVVLRDLSEVVRCIHRDGYFLVSSADPPESHTLRQIVPGEYYEQFALDPRLAGQPVVGAGIIGFNRRSAFFADVIEPTYQRTVDGHALGWSPVEIARNRGIHWNPNPILRDCDLFRHDQTLLNLALYRHPPERAIHPVTKYAGYRSTADHPEQLIWNSRGQEPLTYIGQLGYRRLRHSRNFVNRALHSPARLRSLEPTVRRTVSRILRGQWSDLWSAVSRRLASGIRAESDYRR